MPPAPHPIYVGLEQDDSERNAYAEEKFDPYDEEPQPQSQEFAPPPNVRVPRRSLFFHLLGWPTLVIAGQLCLQAVGWIFLAVVRTRGPIPLPYSMAVSVDNNPHIVTLVATLISTFLGGCSSYLFSYALRRSMSLYLLRPVSLAALGASVNISMRAFVFHRRHWKWPAISLLCLIMAGIQTSVWSTLITPVKIDISTPLAGHDIDLASSNLHQIWESKAMGVCLSAGRDGAVYGGVPTSGYANGQSYLGLPAAVSLLGQGFNISTRGIAAATLNDTHVGKWSIPASAHSEGNRGRGISESYSMTQQGFTANVSCTLRNLTSTTTPDVEQSTDSISGWKTNLAANGIDRANITWVNVASNCFGTYLVNLTDVYFDSTGEYMWAVGCDPTPAAPNEYSLILQATGNYTDLSGPDKSSYLVCQIAPTTSVVHVDYADGINALVQSVDPPTSNAGGAAGFFAMYIITDLVWHQQALNVNGVADQLQELLENVAADKRLEVIAEYLQGVVEYSASILRACLSAQDLVFTGGVPTNLTRATTGTWTTQTLGWKPYSTGTTLWILVPGLFMACSTLALVIVAVWRHGPEMRTHTTTFDPSNPLHLMAAAASGGLNGVFRSLKERDIDEGGRLNVVLGSVPGRRGPALVRADNVLSSERGNVF